LAYQQSLLVLLVVVFWVGTVLWLVPMFVSVLCTLVVGGILTYQWVHRSHLRQA
jgi:hypothetical protein